MNIKNKRASFDYEFIDEYDAGIMLVGSEVKSISLGNASISEAYCSFYNNELYIYGMHIAEYQGHNALGTHDPNRHKKLLLTKKELKGIKELVERKGMSIIPHYLFTKNGKFKLKICIGKGKKLHDKRQSIKEKDLKKNNKYLE